MISHRQGGNTMRRRVFIGGVGAATGVTLLAPNPASATIEYHQDRHRPGRPLIIGHRGASGHRPEHTLESYRLAIALGVDYIEPDLVSTKDGQLIARHENEISGTTNVAAHPEFASRKATKTVDGVPVTGWFTEDFTLTELKTLRAVERLPAVRPHNTIYDGLFEIPTLQEIINLARSEGQRVGRTIGIYPETKHPTYFTSIGKPLEPALAAVLRRNGLAHRDAAVFLQSFEPGSLQKLRSLVDTPSIQLLDATGGPWDLHVAGDPRTYADLAKPDGLGFIHGFANGIGVNKNLVIPRDANGALLAPTSLVADAHARGLVVHSWTFRNENTFLPANLQSGPDPTAWGHILDEFRAFLATGLDGVFADFADTALLARGR
jgi:glycerophosphoryl diester phosphodiesterase